MERVLGITLDDLPIALRGKVRETPGGCWEWCGGRSSQGYGRARIGNKLQHPHRVVARHFGILTDESLQVCHRCDNPPCCNPAHLFAGTRSENMRDAHRKGRLTCGLNMEIKAVWNKLDGKELALLAATLSVREIARRLDVHHKLVSRALHAYLDTIRPMEVAS